MTPNLKNIFIIAIVLMCSNLMNAQFLEASDTSESSVKRYKSIINANKDIVNFIEHSLAEKGDRKSVV